MFMTYECRRYMVIHILHPDTEIKTTSRNTAHNSRFSSLTQNVYSAVVCALAALIHSLYARTPAL